MAAAANTLGVNLDATRAAGALLKGPVVQAPTPPAPLGAPPTVATAADRARQQREQQDALAKKRGRAASIFTGDTGVAPNATPLGFKTLVGS